MMTGKQKRTTKFGMEFVKSIRALLNERIGGVSVYVYGRWLGVSEGSIRHAEERGNAVNLGTLARHLYLGEKYCGLKPRRLLDMIYEEWLPKHTRTALDASVTAHKADQAIKAKKAERPE